MRFELVSLIFTKKLTLTCQQNSLQTLTENRHLNITIESFYLTKRPMPLFSMFILSVTITFSFLVFISAAFFFSQLPDHSKIVR